MINTALITVAIMGVLCLPTALLYYIFRDRFDDVDRYFYSFCGGVLFWCVVGAFAGIYSTVEEARSLVLITLSKAEWSCVHKHKETHLVGEASVVRDVCDTYQSATTQ